MEPDSSIADTGFCAFDVETTGLSGSSRMVEIGAVRFRLGEDGEEFSTLVDPRQSISRGALAIHGIDASMVRGAPLAGQALREFFAFAGDSVLIAHNAGFDVGVVSMELVRSRMAFPDNMVIDNLGIARACLDGRRNFKLGTLAEAIGLETGGLHRALPDARATKLVFEEAIASRGWGPLPLRELARYSGDFGFEDSREVEGDLPPEYDIIREAIETDACLRVVYMGGTKGLEPRLLTPLAVHNRWGSYSLDAFCHVDRMNKTFLLDRFLEIELAD